MKNKIRLIVLVVILSLSGCATIDKDDVFNFAGDFILQWFMSK